MEAPEDFASYAKPAEHIDFQTDDNDTEEKRILLPPPTTEAGLPDFDAILKNVESPALPGAPTVGGVPAMPNFDAILKNVDSPLINASPVAAPQNNPPTTSQGLPDFDALLKNIDAPFTPPVDQENGRKMNSV